MSGLDLAKFQLNQAGMNVCSFGNFDTPTLYESLFRLAGAVAAGTFDHPQMGPVDTASPLTIGAFSGDLFITVATPAVVAAAPPRDIKYSPFALLALSPGHFTPRPTLFHVQKGSFHSSSSCPIPRRRASR